MTARRPKELRLPWRRYCEHQHNAELRNVEWKITFEEWWEIWRTSGHWHERGWGSEKYCMCRVGDKGPYAVGNVFIATNRENLKAADRSYLQKIFRELPVFRSGRILPTGVRSQRGKYYATKRVNGVQYHIGTFATPELARTAYENFTR